MGVGYGMLAMVKSQMYDDKQLDKIEPKSHLQLNLAHEPQHTYIFDEYSQEKLDDLLDRIAFFSEITMGLSMKDFILREKTLG